jgi:tetratricopeptide (TPR) repeat protein
LRLGKIYEKTANYNLALSQYQEIIDHHNGIYIDEALFSAEIYNKKLKETEKAKPLYEKDNSITDIYFVEARKTSGNWEILIYKSLTV